MSSSTSPPRKRIKIESPSPPSQEEEEEDNCSICLQALVGRTIIPTCSHEFCFDCLVVWTEQSRKCPLCAQTTGEYLIHRIRSRYDYQKHYLVPLSKPGLLPLHAVTNREPEVHRQRRRREWGRRDQNEVDKLERSIEKRRWVYEHRLYAKHVASNVYTKYRPYPTPAQFAASQEMVSKTTMFLRREFRVWDDLDVEFFTTFTISLMKSIDIRSESAVKLLAEFLDIDTGGRVMAEHFVHEVYSYVRLPFKGLFVYDSAVQYDTPPYVGSPPRPRPRRWREVNEHPRQKSRPRSRSPTPCNHNNAPLSSRDSDWHEDDVSRVRSISWSPSGCHYPSASRAPSHSVDPPVAQATIPDEMDMPTSITDAIEVTRPDVKGKSRVNDEFHDATPSNVGFQPNMKGKSREDIPCLLPAPSNIPEITCVRSKKPVRTALESLRAHLGASSLSSPTLLNRLSSRIEDKKRQDNSCDALGSQSSSDWDQSSAEKKEEFLMQGRAHLLGKLLERRRAPRPEAAVDDVERRLKTRALVRVRLAAEKRARERSRAK
ncbi:uncharacterized protein EV420DRAFT_1209068 [Desarmillaria tabescens]|uniref:RING-type E3 ubiquitin transferase n=1 Tax=Armillaria tabescens TaxID=1929756 RepID=A0AA39JDC1_ARMTA|nr:uncharacterized protein EV420DRAFT_1209068 [Desarmillaria tabescens]KAK0438523.1 hypothetical protein EV420DRAFT_1209068 [Desarmillaria tabescens]